VIVASDDIYGHGVNIAARLESLAPPGGICISADAWRQARGTVAAEFADLGKQRLKNIADPAHVFALSLQRRDYPEPDSAPQRTTATIRPRQTRQPIVVIYKTDRRSAMPRPTC
jgi:hypothetical protein